MQAVLSPDEMRAADAAAIAAGTPEAVLMERAGHACAVAGMRMIGGAYGKRVVIVCGKGNNGGDGLVCGSYLADRGVHTTVIRTDRWTREEFDRAVHRADLVVDAILGTGSSGPPRGDVASAIEAIDACGRPVLAIDIPSGVSGADGSVHGPAVKAGVTLAIQALKAGHVSPPGAFRCGRIDVADIGIPLGAARTFVPETFDIPGVLPPRKDDTHKYEVGAVALLAGSAGMTGAGILAAKGAMRAGAGLVISGVAHSTLHIVEAAVVEAVKVGLPDVEGQLEAKAVDEFADRMSKARALAVGPGLGRGLRAVGVIRQVLEVDLPLVVDADGLWALAEVLRDDPAVLSRRAQPAILTPHAGEFAFLAGRPPHADRVGDVRAKSEEWGAVLHLKGRRAITAAPDGRVWVNTTGNPGGATGGTGDVLTGIVAAFVARGMSAPDAMWAGAFVHGAAIDAAAARAGMEGMTSSDVAEAIPVALRRIRSGKPAASTIRTVIEGS